MSREPPPSRTAPQFVVRLPNEEFRDQIAAAASANGRSMNAEIVSRLQQSFAHQPVDPDIAAGELIRQKYLADTANRLRVLMADALAVTLGALPTKELEKVRFSAHALILEWLAGQNPGNAAANVLQLIDAGDQEPVRKWLKELAARPIDKSDEVLQALRATVGQDRPKLADVLHGSVSEHAASSGAQGNKLDRTNQVIQEPPDPKGPVRKSPKASKKL